MMALERIDVQQALDEGCNRQCTMNVNLRVGQELVLCPRGHAPIVIRLEAKHGNGGRLRVSAVRSVKITPPDD